MAFLFFDEHCPFPLIASHNIADDDYPKLPERACYAEKTVIGMFVCDRYLIAQTLLAHGAKTACFSLTEYV